MDGGEIFGWIWFGICALPFAGIALYFIIMGQYCLLELICKGLYKIRVFHLIYYLTPNEFKYDPEQPLGNQRLSDAFLCSCCNSSLLLYQLCRGFNRIIVDNFRNLFHYLCGCIIRRRRRQTRNNDLELPISHPLPHKLLSKNNYNKSNSTIEEKQQYNKKDLKISPPEPVVFLTNPPRVTPMSTTTTHFNTASSSSSSPSSSSNTTIPDSNK